MRLASAIWIRTSARGSATAFPHCFWRLPDEGSRASQSGRAIN
jgi:hypothetical protein